MRIIMAKFPFFQEARQIHRTEEEVAGYAQRDLEQKMGKEYYFFVDITTDIST